MFADGIQSLEYSQNFNLREVVFHLVKCSSKGAECYFQLGEIFIAG